MLLFVLLVSLIVRLWYFFHQSFVFWDSAMYIGSGKYMFSGGTIGFFELFRPPILPIVLGALWKIGLDPYLSGKIVMFIASLALIWLIYKIGQKISPFAGTVAALLFSLTPFVLLYGTPPLSDVPSALFAFLAAFFTLEKKYWRAGFMVAIAFGIRFPAGLILVPLCLYMLIDSATPMQSLRNILKTVGGFVLVTAPYWIVNASIYGNPLYPVLDADKVATAPVGAHSIEIFFYAKNLLLQNPLLIFSLVALIPLYALLKKIILNIKNKEPLGNNLTGGEKVLFLASLSTLIIGGYFGFNTNIDVRFAIAFLPYLSLLGAYGIALLVPHRGSTEKIIIGCVTLVLLIICTRAYTGTLSIYSMPPALEDFYTFFNDKPSATLITTSPETMIYTNIKLVGATDTWEDSLSELENVEPKPEYVALNSCALVCKTDEASCTEAHDAYLTYLTSSRTKVFDETVSGCSLEIYK